MDPIVPIAWLGLVATWCLVYKLTVTSRFSAPALFLYLNGLKLVVRAGLLVFGVTEVNAPRLYRIDMGPLTTDAIMYSIVWLLLFGVAFVAFRRPAEGLKWLLPRLETEPNQRVWIIALVLFSIPGALAAMTALSSGGGLAGSVQLVRSDSLFGGAGIIRKIPQVALALSSAAVAYENLRRRRAPRMTGSGSLQVRTARRSMSRLMIVGIITGVVNLIANLSFGDRSSLLIPVALGWLVSRLMLKRRSVVRGMTVALAFFVALVVLGSARGAWRSGDDWEGLSADQFSLNGVVDAVNLESFDRLMLLMQDFDDSSSWRWGEDFTTGFKGVIPRALWNDKPANLSSGTWFRSYYLGGQSSGWPLIAWGEWYLNFGALGVVLSGVLAGLTYRAIHERYRGFEHDPMAAGFMCLIVFFVFPQGIVAYSPIIAVIWLLPLHIFSGSLFAHRRRSSRAVASTTTASAAGAMAASGAATRPSL